MVRLELKFQLGSDTEMSTFDLFSSVRDGNTDIVRRLLQSKLCRARLNDRNEWGDTALHLAAEAGNGERLKACWVGPYLSSQ